MKKPSWFLVLEAVRKVDSEGEINSRSLSELLDMVPKDASAWLCKLSRWGYLRRAGPSEFGGKRIRYELTDYGVKVKAPKQRREFSKGSGRPAAEAPPLRMVANPKKTEDN